MSLLLDALKRAEQEKAARGDTSGLALVDDSAAPSADGSELPASAVTDNDARAAAQTVFSAKQGGLGGASSTANRKKIVVAGVLVGAVILAAIGAIYVWLETSGAPVAKAPARPPLTPTPQAAAPSAGTPQTAGGSATAAAMKAEPGKAAQPAPRSPSQRVMAAAKPEAGARPLLTQETNTPRVPAKVAQGYEALRSGDWEQAQALYREAIDADPSSVDAHLGLAAASARAGDQAMATRYYREALNLHPGNAAAMAGLAALSDFTRADALEAQLRAEVSKSPANAALRLTLGGLYASQSRWNEAQAAYFEAHRLDPENPDLAFNLAVSLDHLGQQRLATEFYERALASAKDRRAQFDPAQASRRLAELRR